MTGPACRSWHFLVRALLSIALLAESACASRPGPPPVAESVCRRSDVLDFAAAHYRRTALYVRPLPASAAEMPTFDPATALCTLQVEVGRYDTMRDGDRPQVRLEARSFYVTKLGSGYEVDFRGG